MTERNYDDIIDLPHHVSTRHAPMTRENRAAQFAPFAALVGYDDAVKEEARLTGKKIELSEERIELLNNRIYFLSQTLCERHLLHITYFKHDTRKAGGEYVDICGTIHSIDEVGGFITMSDRQKIAIDDLLMIEGEVFKFK